jgi:hypothetical protein
MRIKLLFFSGVIGKNEYLRRGEIHDVPEELANDLLARGRAVLPETAVAAPLENAALRVGGPPPSNRPVVPVPAPGPVPPTPDDKVAPPDEGEAIPPPSDKVPTPAPAPGPRPRIRK